MTISWESLRFVDDVNASNSTNSHHRLVPLAASKVVLRLNTHRYGSFFLYLFLPEIVHIIDVQRWILSGRLDYVQKFIFSSTQTGNHAFVSFLTALTEAGECLVTDCELFCFCKRTDKTDFLRIVNDLHDRVLYTTTADRAIFLHHLATFRPYSFSFQWRPTQNKLSICDKWLSNADASTETSG